MNGVTTDPKTTWAGVIGGILTILASFGVVLPDWLSSEQTVGLIAGIAVMVVGVLARDGHENGVVK